jgi:hypothetical protein
MEKERDIFIFLLSCMVQPFHLFRFVIYINHVAILLWMLRHFHCGLWQCDASFAFGEFMDGCCWVGAILVFGCFFLLGAE